LVCASPYLISARPAKLSALVAIPIARPVTASGWITEHHEAPHIVERDRGIKNAGYSIIVDHACPGARPNSRELVASYVPDKSIVVNLAASPAACAPKGVHFHLAIMHFVVSKNVSPAVIRICGIVAAAADVLVEVIVL
jgi:hypothetical protein